MYLTNLMTEEQDIIYGDNWTAYRPVVQHVEEPEEEDWFESIFGGPNDAPLAFDGAPIPTKEYVPLPVLTPAPPVPWRDRPKDMKNAGAKKKTSWESSVLKYVKNVVKEIGWINVTLCMEVVGAMRLLTDNYDSVREVIALWDSYPEKEKKRVFSLDKAVDECSVDRDEFAGLVLAAVQKHLQRQSVAIINKNRMAIIEATIDHAVHGGAAGAKERVELLKILDRMAARDREDANPKVTRASKTESADETGSTKPLDSQSSELDDIDSLGVN